MPLYTKNICIGEATIPTLEIALDDPTKVTAIFFDENKTRYYFSNELGHRVINGSDQRPMTKKEYKDIYEKMVMKTLAQPEDENILDEIIKLDFKTGHANSTFEINRPRLSIGPGALVLNQGVAKYIYNVNSNTVYHINYNKRINGSFMENGPEKDHIVKILTNSRTIQRKMQQ